MNRRTLSIVALLLAVLGPAAPSPVRAASVSGSVQVVKKFSDRTHEKSSNAVVWLSGVATPPPVEAITVDQRKKKFLPRVLPVVRGQVVHFLNQDKVDHNVFSTDPREAFDLGRYPKGEQRPVTFDVPGFFRVYCDIHKSMILDVAVLENPYFAVTDEDGVFSIDGVPEGSYRLHVWHIYGGTHEQPLAVATEPVALEPIRVKSTKVVRDVKEHLNKQGKRYPKKNGY